MKDIHYHIRLFLLLFIWLLAQAETKAQERKSFIPRTIDWGYNIVQGDSSHPYKKYIFAVPILAYKPETKWIFGISLAHIFRTQQNDSLTRPSTIRVNVAYSQMKQFSVKPHFEYFSKRNRLNIRLNYLYTNFAEYYWGLGADAPDANKELYKFNMQKGNARAAYLFLPNFYAGIQYNFEYMYEVKYNEGSQLETSGIKGSKGYYASGFGPVIYIDNRDNIYFPYHGNYIELSNIFYNPSFGGSYKFTNITLDARKYLQLWKENILAFQFYLNSNSGNIPFRMLGTVGSDSYMRGYYNGRYRDNYAFAFQGELRKTIWGPIGCVVFAGCGSVSHGFNELSSNVMPNIGAGLRIKAIPRERLNMRMDYGIGSSGNSAFYLTLMEAF